MDVLAFCTFLHTFFLHKTTNLVAVGIVFIWHVQFTALARGALHSIVYDQFIYCADWYSMFCLFKLCHGTKHAKICWSKGHQKLCYSCISAAGMTSTPSIFRAFCLVLCLAPGSNGNQKGHGGRSQSSALMTLASRQTVSAYPIRWPPNTVSSPCIEPLQSLIGVFPFSHSLWFPSQETTKSFSHRNAH